MEQKTQRKKYITPVLVSRGKVTEVTLQVSQTRATGGSFFSSPVDGSGV